MAQCSSLLSLLESRASGDSMPKDSVKSPCGAKAWEKECKDQGEKDWDDRFTRLGLDSRSMSDEVG